MFHFRLDWAQESPGHCRSALSRRQRLSRRLGGHPYADCDAHHSRSRVGHASRPCATVPHRSRSTTAPRVPNGLNPVFDWYWLYYVCRLVPQDSSADKFHLVARGDHLVVTTRQTSHLAGDFRSRLHA